MQYITAERTRIFPWCHPSYHLQNRRSLISLHHAINTDYPLITEEAEIPLMQNPPCSYRTIKAQPLFQGTKIIGFI